MAIIRVLAVSIAALGLAGCGDSKSPGSSCANPCEKIELTFIEGVHASMVSVVDLSQVSDATLQQAGEEFCASLSALGAPTKTDFDEIASRIGRTTLAAVRNRDYSDPARLGFAQDLAAHVVGGQAVDKLCPQYADVVAPPTTAPTPEALQLAERHRQRLVALNEYLGTPGDVSSVQELASGYGTTGDALLCDPAYDADLDSLLSSPREHDPRQAVPSFLAVLATYCPARYAAIEQRFQSYPETSDLPFADYRRVLSP